MITQEKQKFYLFPDTKEFMRLHVGNTANMEVQWWWENTKIYNIIC